MKAIEKGVKSWRNKSTPKKFFFYFFVSNYLGGVFK